MCKWVSCKVHAGNWHYLLRLHENKFVMTQTPLTEVEAQYHSGDSERKWKPNSDPSQSDVIIDPSFRKHGHSCSTTTAYTLLGGLSVRVWDLAAEIYSHLVPRELVRTLMPGDET